jgi:hypothetical protein
MLKGLLIIAGIALTLYAVFYFVAPVTIGATY